MITVKEYLVKKEELLDQYEKSVREWLKEDDKHKIAQRIPFFRDGVTCPEVWFKPGNDFRPLFILKETSIGKDCVNDLNGFLERWGNQTTFEFVENPFDDVKIGKFTFWRKIAALAKGLEDIHNGIGVREYNINEFAYKIGGEKYTGTIEGYRDYNARTANELYNDIINKIAVLEIKKIGGGRSTGSELSLATKYYSEHISPFQDLIVEEIKLINPTVIIVCSREVYSRNLLKEIEKNTGDAKWIYGYHPTRNTIENFYYKPVKEFTSEK